MARDDLHDGLFFAPRSWGIKSYMERKTTYMRAWRSEKGFTLEQMVGRLEELGFQTTAASISRIETGKQPYGQDFLEAYAAALGCSPADLLENDPSIPDAEVIDFLRHLSTSDKRKAGDVLKAMFGNAS